MRYYLILISALLLTGCKKDIDPTEGKEVLKAGFVYVNPEGKQLRDSIIIVPPKLSAVPVDRSYIHYEGAIFKSNIKVKKNKIEQNYPGTPVVKWVLYDLDNKKIVKTESTSDIILDIASVGRYRLTQYIFKNKEESETLDMAVDSASKMVEVTAFKSIDSIVIDKLSSHSPYLTYSFKEDEAFDAVVSLYNSLEDAENNKKPIAETDVIKALKLGASQIAFTNTDPIFIPTFDFPEKDDFYLQLIYMQNGKKFRILDNHFGTIFKYYKTGYLTDDKSTLQEERKLKFGDMTLTISSSFTFQR